MKRFSQLSFIVILLGLLYITGCTSIPKDALTLNHESLAERQKQTRKYKTKDETKILAACAGLLQDMGFNIDESETKLGLITASKMRSAVNPGQIVGTTLIGLLTYNPSMFLLAGTKQKIRASVVTRPIGEHDEYIAVRVTFQRIVYNIDDQVIGAESLDDPAIYQEFFDKLSKAIFLEEQEI